MVGLEVLTLVPQLGKNCFFLSLIFFLGGAHERPIGHSQFQNVLRSVAKFRENQFGDVKKSVGGRTINKTTRVKYNSLRLLLQRQ